jgi:hypothetical protein
VTELHEKGGGVQGAMAPHLSRTGKIEDLADTDVAASQDTGASEPVVSMNALAHAIAGSIGGNIAMLGEFSRPALVGPKHGGARSAPSGLVLGLASASCKADIKAWGPAFYPLDQLVIRAQTARRTIARGTLR